MNPPYSHGIERGHDSRTGARHLRSAWNRLPPAGGSSRSCLNGSIARGSGGAEGAVSLRLNAAVERAFVKQGTGITTRLLVLDKVEGSNEPVAIRTNDFASWSILSMPCRLAQLDRFLNNRASRLVRRFVW
jgi:hypothetical protein